MADYYDTPAKKVGDFFVGFLGNLMLGVIFFYVFSFLMQYFYNLFPILLGIVIVIEILPLMYFFKTRRYIAIGMLSAIALPLLVFGFCTIMLFSGKLY